MKLTWFGGTTVRVHIGGKILVIDAEGASAEIDRVELLSGADMQFALDDGATSRVSAPWAPRKIGALIDAPDMPIVQVHSLSAAAMVVDAIGEQPLLIVTGPVERFGRWSTRAVVLVMGEPQDLPEFATQMLDLLAPRLIVIAAPDDVTEQAIGRLKDRLDGTGLVALEAGLGMEV